MVLINTSEALAKSSRLSASKPNIVFVLADDFGWADTSYNPGAEPYLTPNIDKMVANGLKLNRFYPGAGNCSPRGDR